MPTFIRAARTRRTVLSYKERAPDHVSGDRAKVHSIRYVYIGAAGVNIPLFARRGRRSSSKVKNAQKSTMSVLTAVATMRDEKTAHKGVPPIELKPLPAKLYRVALVGDAGTGKTSIIANASDEKISHVTMTLGLEIKIFSGMGDNKVRLRVWDTVGQEKFGAIPCSFYRDLDGVIFVYDVKRSDTLAHIDRWRREVLEHSHTPPMFFLIGNKNDLREPGATGGVPRETGIRYAEQKEFCFFYEGSAKTDVLKDAVFHRIATLLSTSDPVCPRSTGINLSTFAPKSQSCCGFS